MNSHVTLAFAAGTSLGIGITYFIIYIKKYTLFYNNKNNSFKFLYYNKEKDTLNNQSNGNLKIIENDYILHLIRPNIINVKPYRCARDDYTDGILLDANENSYGSSISDEIIYKNLKLERYPCPYQNELKQLIGNYRNVRKENIFLGVGSDEAIDLLIRVFCIPSNDKILITPPTYGMYAVSASINDVKVIEIPLIPSINKNINSTIEKTTFQMNTPEILEAIRNVGENLKILYLCSPGNPTSHLLNQQDIIHILNSEYKGIVVVDEAYIDFTDTENSSILPLIYKYNRLIVLQTFSKAFGLAGIRVGMAFGNTNIINLLNKIKAPYNINKLSSMAAIKAIKNTEIIIKNIKKIKLEKNRVIKILERFKFVKKVYSSDTNFVLFEIENAFAVYKKMAAQGVVIRYRGNLIHLKNCLRATIGTFEENQEMLDLLQNLCQSITSN